MRIEPEQFREAWPRVVRNLAAWTGSLDDAEEYAAEAMARAVDADDVRDLAAWCVTVARRRWLDDHRRRALFDRRAPELAATDEVRGEGVDDPLERTGLDDRLALLFVACDDALPPGAQLVLALRVVCGLSAAQTAAHLGIQESAAAARLTRAKKSLAQARGEFRVPDEQERVRRLPVVLDCVAGMFTVAHRSELAPADPHGDTGRQALSLADALVALHPEDPEVRGLRAVVRLGLARRPGRVDADGVALTLAEVDRSGWDAPLVRAGLRDATLAARGHGRFALEAAISGLHTTARTFAETDWPRIAQLYAALEQVWPSPAVRVASLAARAQADPAPEVERELAGLAAAGPSYARRDATFVLADLRWREERYAEAATLYRRLLDDGVGDEAVRRFCERRAGS